MINLYIFICIVLSTPFCLFVFFFILPHCCMPFWLPLFHNQACFYLYFVFDSTLRNAFSSEDIYTTVCLNQLSCSINKEHTIRLRPNIKVTGVISLILFMGSFMFYMIHVMNVAVSLITIEFAPNEYETLGVCCYMSFLL